MRTFTLYLGESERKRRRRRSKWMIPLLVGFIAAAFAFGRPKAPTEELPLPIAASPAEVVTTEIATATLETPVVAPAVPIVPPPPALPAHAVVTPARVDFGDGPMNRGVAAQLVTLHNDGGQPIARITTAVDGPFIATNGCTGGLAPGADCIVAVVFAPQQPGKFAAALTIANGSERSHVALRGSVARAREGGAPPPVVAQAPPPVVVRPPPRVDPPRQICVDPPSLVFTRVGRRAITLTNPESTPLHVMDVAVFRNSGQSASGYQIDSRKCIRVLNPGERCKLTVLASQLALQMQERIELKVYYDDLTTGARRVAGVSTACRPNGR